MSNRGGYDQIQDKPSGSVAWPGLQQTSGSPGVSSSKEESKVAGDSDSAVSQTEAVGLSVSGPDRGGRDDSTGDPTASLVVPSSKEESKVTEGSDSAVSPVKLQITQTEAVGFSVSGRDRGGRADSTGDPTASLVVPSVSPSATIVSSSKEKSKVTVDSDSAASLGKLQITPTAAVGFRPGQPFLVISQTKPPPPPPNYFPYGLRGGTQNLPRGPPPFAAGRPFTHSGRLPAPPVGAMRPGQLSTFVSQEIQGSIPSLPEENASKPAGFLVITPSEQNHPSGIASGSELLNHWLGLFDSYEFSNLEPEPSEGSDPPKEKRDPPLPSSWPTCPHCKEYMSPRYNKRNTDLRYFFCEGCEYPRGSTVIGITTKEGIVLAVEKPSTSPPTEKIMKIDDLIVCARTVLMMMFVYLLLAYQTMIS